MISSLGILHSFKKIYKERCKYFYYFPGLPYLWNNADQKLHIHVVPKSWFLWELIFFTLFMNSLSKLYRSKHEGKIEQSSMTLIISVFTSAGCCCLWALISKRNSFASFLNGVLEEERRWNRMIPVFLRQSASLRPQKFAKIIIEGFILGEIAFPILLGGGSGIVTCSAPNLLVDLNQYMGWCIELRRLRYRDSVIFLVGSGIHYLIWMTAMRIGTMISMHIYVGCLCLKACLNLFLELFQRKILQTPEECILFYRRIQILAGLYNEAHIKILFFIISGVSGFQTCLAYILFKSVRSKGNLLIPAPILIFNFLFLVETLTFTLVAYSLAGSVHKIGVRNIHKVKSIQRNVVKSGRRREWNRVQKSFAPVKVALGLSNYVECVTSLRFVNFSVERFIDILLSEKRRSKLY